MATLHYLSVCILSSIIIFTDATLQGKEKSFKTSLITEIARKMDIIASTSLRANRFYSINPNRVLEYLRKRVWNLAGARPNGKLYVDIIMKGFQILIPKRDNITKHVQRNQIALTKYNVSQIRSDKWKSSLRYKIGPKLDIIDDIMMKLRKFSEIYKISIDDAFDILKYKLNEAADEELRYIIPAAKLNISKLKIPVYNDKQINNIQSFPREKVIKSEKYNTNDTENVTTSMYIIRHSTPMHDNCTPRKCFCQGNITKSMECIHLCPRVCEHMYNLNRWICISINDTNSIPIDLLCDGLVDCKDQSDELSCNYKSDKSKHFEANKMINQLILMEPLTKNSQVKDYNFLKYKLKSLHERIVHLTNTNHIASEGDVQMVTLRNDVLDEILSLYKFLSKDYTEIDEIENAYKAFLNLKILVMKTLKLYITGNRRLVPEGKCLCREGMCSVAQCSKDCESICTTLPMFTRYHCTNTGNNDTYVPLKSLCDGRFDCPKKDDETNCIREPCRIHHLIILKHKLLSHQQQYKGTRVKETIRSWLSQVIRNIEKEEASVEDKRSVLKELTLAALTNLTYDYKKSDQSHRVDSNPIEYYPIFYQAAQLVIEAKMTCDM